MEVRQLQIFRTLADELNFTRTAEKVNTVQSNVTAQIKALEEELGVPLFDRLGRRVTLTDAGRRFRPFAEQALVAMEQGQRAIRNGAEPSGPLRISAPESILTYRLPQVLRLFRRRFPNVEIAFRPHLDDSIAAELESGKLDLVINMCDAPSNPAHRSLLIRTERIFLFGDPSHPLTDRRTVKPIDLAGQTLLLTEHGCGYRAKLDRALALQNVRPGNITEFSSVEAMKQCVRVGMGLALLPAIVIARELRQRHFKTLHWAGPSLDITTYVLWHRDKWLSPAMAAFLDLLRSQADDPATDSALMAS
ncbi:MAG TPA: LysR family transcriptional regulator [Terracidiphilus sp.]|jgi:DNA-binding transcriptional LysR family regulator|nr:LysR family transcriptional regulator [Terracidiphilus sp.]